MNINQQIESTRQELINTLNNSQLPVGIAYYILKDIMTEVNNMYQASLSEVEPITEADEGEGVTE